jgi:hypothetical protein
MAINTFSGGNIINSLEAAGKNAILNSDFSVWQRGTSFSNPATGAFTADRWSVVWDGSGATRTISQQTFTPGNAIPGYEFPYFYRFAQSVAGTGAAYNLFQNRMEDVRTFAGQTVTISFWAKAAANTNLAQLNLEQDFGTGGSPSATVSNTVSTGTITVTTSWQRFSYTTTVPSISGKTVGTTTPGYLGLRIWVPINATFTLDFVGFQMELGTTATTFQTATGTIQGELAACQRYYWRSTATSNYSVIGAGGGNCTGVTTVRMFIANPVNMRTTPSSIDYGGALACSDGVTLYTTGSFTIQTNSTPAATHILYTHGTGVLTQYRWYNLQDNNANTAYVGVSAEL